MNRNNNTVGSLWQNLGFSKREFEVIVGTVLGDAYIDQFPRDARISILHSFKQRELVDWKHDELKRFVKMQPMSSSNVDKRTHKTYSSWRFQTKRYPQFKKIARIFYQGRRKFIPRNIDRILTPLSLAVWYMDDGGRRNDCHGVFLNTLCYTKKEQIILQNCLFKNFGIESNIHWISDGFRLYIPISSSKKFCQIIGPYIIPSMRYKLPYDPVTTESAGIKRKR